MHINELTPRWHIILASSLTQGVCLLMKLHYVWGLLILFRLIVAITSTSYIHPDEHFQNPEIAADYVFDYGANELVKTWEWNPPGSRSIVPLQLSLIPAFAALRWFDPTPSAHALFLAERTSMWLASLTLDACVYALSGDMQKVIALALSPVMLTFMLRPFSNAFESLLFAVALVLIKRRKTVVFGSLLGCTFALGVFNRVTFFAFGASAVLPHAWSLLKSKKVYVLASLVSFVSLSALFIHADSVFFGLRTVTPLNLFFYNANASNLAQHGLHPRYLHVLVNMPLLFLPLMLYCTGISTPIVLPLVFLSLIPHQEPRFLIPLLVPMVVSLKKRLSKTFWFIYGAHSLVLVAVFGYFHQGSVIPVAFKINALLSSNSAPYHVIFWKVFMPPRHLLLSLANCAVRTRVTSLDGAALSALLETLRQSDSTSLLVLPSYMAHMLPPSLALSPVFKNVGFHLDTDKLGALILNLPNWGIDVYKISS